MLLFGIAHLLLVELDDDGAELENVPQQRVLRQLHVDPGAERLKRARRKRCEKSLFGAQERRAGRKAAISIGRKMLKSALVIRQKKAGEKGDGGGR